MTRRALLQRISIISNRKHPAVVAGLVPATPRVRPQSKQIKVAGKPGRDPERRRMIQYDRDVPSWSDSEI